MKIAGMKTIKNKITGIASAMMLSCEQAGLLLSKKQHQSLSYFDTIKLKLHLIVCKVCRIYKIEIDLLHNDLQHLNMCSVEGCSHHILSTDQKKKITSSIEKQPVN